LGAPFCFVNVFGSLEPSFSFSPLLSSMRAGCKHLDSFSLSECSEGGARNGPRERCEKSFSLFCRRS